MDMAEDNMEIGTHCYTSPPNRQGLCLRENRVLKIKNKQEQEQKCQGPSAESREQNPLFKRLVHQRSAEMRCTIKSFISLCECFIFAVAFCVHKSLWMQNAALTHSVATSVTESIDLSSITDDSGESYARWSIGTYYAIIFYIQDHWYLY